MKEDYPKYCFENLLDEVERLRKKGRTGVETRIVAKDFENRLKTSMKKIIKREFRGTSNLSGCFECEWNGEGKTEAREHCKKTGHKTWNEYLVATHYEQKNET